jgi:hypothetical protein
VIIAFHCCCEFGSSYLELICLPSLNIQAAPADHSIIEDIAMSHQVTLSLSTPANCADCVGSTSRESINISARAAYNFDLTSGKDLNTVFHKTLPTTLPTHSASITDQASDNFSLTSCNELLISLSHNSV